jgi:predicted XRE-type DNA-binding protein
MAYKNPFEAFGFEKDEATIRALRSDFAAILREWIGNSRLTQGEAGARLGVPQSTVSSIVNGRTRSMSIEFLIRLLARGEVPWAARCSTAPSDAEAVAGAAPLAWTNVGSLAVSVPVNVGQPAGIGQMGGFFGNATFVASADMPAQVPAAPDFERVEGNG